MRRRQSRSRSPSPTSRQHFSSFKTRLPSNTIMARIAMAGATALLLVFLVQFSTSQMPDPQPLVKAVVVLAGDSAVKGVIRLAQEGGSVHLIGNITGLKPGPHGFHVHVHGDLTNGCTSAGTHFDPNHQTHGSPNALVRHAGDLGNVVADASGTANIDITQSGLSLEGPGSIVGRALVVHEKVDDLGLGGNPESLKTGNAGGRLACGVIGYVRTPAD